MHKDQTLSDRVDLILQESKRIGLSGFLLALIYLVVTVGLAVALDVGVIAEGWETWMLLVTVPLGYWLTVSMIKRSGLATDGLQAGFLSYLGLALLAGIAIGFGLMLLIIPGLVLIVRWAPVYGYVLVDGRNVGESFGKAWDETSSHFGPIAVAMLIPILLSMVALILPLLEAAEHGFDAFFEILAADAVSLQISVLANAAVYLSTITGTAIGLAVYSLLRDPIGRVSDVFD